MVRTPSSASPVLMWLPVDNPFWEASRPHVAETSFQSNYAARAPVDLPFLLHAMDWMTPGCQKNLSCCRNQQLSLSYQWKSRGGSGYEQRTVMGGFTLTDGVHSSGLVIL